MLDIVWYLSVQGRAYPWSEMAASTGVYVLHIVEKVSHTDLVGRLGPLELVLNTPSHHASNDEYLDRNYGGILIVWDRLFGTFAGQRRQTELVYGLVHAIGSRNPLKLAFHEWSAWPTTSSMRTPGGPGCDTYSVGPARARTSPPPWRGRWRRNR